MGGRSKREGGEGLSDEVRIASSPCRCRWSVWWWERRLSFLLLLAAACCCCRYPIGLAIPHSSLDSRSLIITVSNALLWAALVCLLSFLSGIEEEAGLGVDRQRESDQEKVRRPNKAASTHMSKSCNKY